MLSAVEIKLLRLMLDSYAHPGEAEASRRKLIAFLVKRGLSGHDIVELIQTASEQIGEDGLPPKMSRPDYGLCKMPFGKSEGQYSWTLHRTIYAVRVAGQCTPRNWLGKLPSSFTTSTNSLSRPYE